MKTWKKAVFIIVLVAFIGLSVLFTFHSIARDTYEFEQQTDVGEVKGLNGWVFFGFNGNTATTKVNIDYVRDEKGENPDTSKPIVGVDSFTIVSDEYVEYIYIGKDVKYISDSAFYYCKKLKAVFVDEANPNYVSVNGCLYTKDMKTLVLHPIFNGDWQQEQGLTDDKETYTVPEGVENIGAYALYKNDGLKTLNLPSTLKHIGNMAIFGCNQLSTVWLPEGLETIGADTFSYCSSMGPVMYIPASVKEIGHHAFFSCTGASQMYVGGSEQGRTFGESWLPKSIKKGLIFVTPEPVWGKTLSDAKAESDRINAENAQQEG